MINEAFAARYFPASDPIGQTVGLGGPDHASDFQIVGVVDDLTYRQPRQPVAPMVTFPAFQAADYEDATMRTVVARSMALRLVLVHFAPSAGPGLVDRLRAAVAGFDRGYNDWRPGSITWTVPADFESTILWVDLRDGRSGRAFAELFFVVEDDS